MLQEELEDMLITIVFFPSKRKIMQNASTSTTKYRNYKLKMSMMTCTLRVAVGTFLDYLMNQQDISPS